MFKTLLTGAVLGCALLLSPLSSAEPMPQNEPTAQQPHMDHDGGDRLRHDGPRHEHRHHHHHHHHHHHG